MQTNEELLFQTPPVPFPLGLVDIQGLRGWLMPALGQSTRPSRELIYSWRANGMPWLDLGPRMVRYDTRSVWLWIQSRKVQREVQRLIPNTSERLVADPRLRHLHR